MSAAWLLTLPTVVEICLFFRETDFSQATIIGQFMDTLVWIIGAVVCALFLAVLASIVSTVWSTYIEPIVRVGRQGKRRPRTSSLFKRTWWRTMVDRYCEKPLPGAGALFKRVWWLSALASTFSLVILINDAYSPLWDHIVLVTVIAAGAVASFLAVLASRPHGVDTPLPALRKASATTLAGVVSLAGIQAWNTLQFAPSQQEQKLTTTATVTATELAGNTTRVSAVITTKNDGDVPALVVASQYVLSAVDVTGSEGLSSTSGGDPLGPDKIANNGAGTETVIGSGIFLLPYQRVSAKSEAQFTVALLTHRKETAYRLSIRLFSARADRLFVKRPADVTPLKFEKSGEQGSQLVKQVQEGSRLRAFTRQDIVVVATWFHTTSGKNANAPRLNVWFSTADAHTGIYKELHFPEYFLSRERLEWTVFRSPASTPKTG
jgi:hypothetical protein